MMDKKVNDKKIKKHFRFRRFFVLILFVYLIYSIIMYIMNMPIKHIEIIGNKHVTDNEIIMIAGIKEYPPIFKLNSKKIEKKINNLDIIKNTEISKKIDGTLIINIIENKPLFYKKSDQKLVLDDKTEVSDKVLSGIPILVNFVPDIIYNEFVKGFSNLNEDIIANISYIEYSPSKNSKNEIIDESRFLLVMNDGNVVYTIPKKISNLNYYLNILSRLEDQKGTLFLDSGNYDNYTFNPFK